MTRTPAFVEDLLSESALRRTGFFDPAAVSHWRSAFRAMRAGSNARTMMELGLVGVVATHAMVPYLYRRDPGGYAGRARPIQRCACKNLRSEGCGMESELAWFSACGVRNARAVAARQHR